MVRTRKSMSSGTTMAPTNLMAASRDWRRRSANAETKSGPAGEVSGAGVAESDLVARLSAEGAAETDLVADASTDGAVSSPDGAAVTTEGSASVAAAVREASSAAAFTLLCLRRRTASLRSSI